jgi:hypothetical protein
MILPQNDCWDLEKTFSGPLPESFTAVDHLTGFDQNLRNPILDIFTRLAQRYQTKITVKLSYFIDDKLQQRYPELNLKFEPNSCPRIHHLRDYDIHPAIDFKNFVCSFNASPHDSRKLLVAALDRFQMADPKYITKNFSFTLDNLDGTLLKLSGDRFNFYRKFFVDPTRADFYQQIIGQAGERSFNHMKNIPVLENMLTQSFIHIVSETMATYHYPLITEKCFYSIVTRGLFLSYAPPHWHMHLEKYYGFRLYKNVFDYQFDTIDNPVERLITLLTMVSKFQKLSIADWYDLYELEKENIEYNYDRYRGGQYMKDLSSD